MSLLFVRVVRPHDITIRGLSVHAGQRQCAHVFTCAAQSSGHGQDSAEEALLHLVETQEEQDRWLIANRDAINAKIRRGIAQSDRGEAHLDAERILSRRI